MSSSQIAVEAAKKLEAQAQSQAEELQREKVALELEASDLRRQCADLQQKASTLSVTPPLPLSLLAAICTLCNLHANAFSRGRHPGGACRNLLGKRHKFPCGWLT